MRRVFLCTIVLTPLLLWGVANAATDPYTPMVGVPGLANANNYTAEMFIKAIYTLAITVGAILAVIQIIFGGVMYMFDGVITHKEAGKDKIKGALFGLLIILGAVLLLETINPNLTKLKIFNDAPSIKQIVAVRNAVTPVTPGGRVSANNAADVKRLKDTCTGPVGSEIINTTKFGVKQIVCYEKVSNANGTPGSTFDPSLFLPAERTAALNQYNKTCASSGGVTNVTIFGTNQCNQRPLTNEENGDIQTGNAM
ncbi:MAG: hypothetical protein RLZZ76_403 [Candidatus Parcubacteria bacterium]|jgi:type IV secretory pathway VirB2 component (pilin)